MKTAILTILSILAVAALIAAAPSKWAYSVASQACIGCGLCLKACPVKAIALADKKAVIDPAACISCGLCAKACPVKAIDKQSDTGQPADGLAQNSDSTLTPDPSQDTLAVKVVSDTSAADTLGRQ